MFTSDRRGRYRAVFCALMLLLATAAPALAAQAPVAEDVPGTGGIGGVGCSGATCLAAGANASNGVVVPISGGTTGGAQNVPGTGVLYTAACASASFCMATGEVGAGSSGDGDGNTVAVTVPVVNGTHGAVSKVKAMSRIFDLSCPTSSSCVGVGTHPTGSGFDTQGGFVTFTGGVAGSVHGVPGTRDLGGIACPTPSECVAVAIGLEGENGIVRIKNGVAGPFVRAKFGNQGLTGPIACVSASRCIAAKFDEFVTIRGTKLGKPKTSGPGTGQIRSITCISAISCVTIKGNRRSLQVSIDGIYGRNITLLPAGFVTSAACMSPTACIAGGGRHDVGTIFRFTPPAAECVVPRLVGKKLAQAKKLLKAASCRAGKIKKRPGSASERGKVVAQGKKPGTRRRAGTKINLTVGS